MSRRAAEGTPTADQLGGGLPTPRVAAALVLGVLGFGVIVGNAFRPGTAAAGAGGRANVTILVAAPAALPAPAVSAATPAADVAEPPAIEDDAGALDDTSLTDDSLLDDSGETASDESASSNAETTNDASRDDTPTDDTSTDDTPTDDTPTVDTSTDDAAEDGTIDDSATTPAPKLPPVKHVWVVALTGHSYDESFGAGSPAPYLSAELRAKGTLLPWYHAPGHDPSAGGVALLGGQKDAVGPFDDKTTTLADQLTGAGRTWKAYIEGATAGLAAGDNPCARPVDQQPRNPFLRFASITQSADCGSSIAELDRLAPDATDSDSAPAFSYILPGPAHDGSTSLADADAWLRTTVPAILDSKAYADGGLVVITFDAGALTDTEAGGGRVGALLLSPFVTPGATIDAPFDAFSLLASIERLFGLEPIGYAKETKLKPFGPKVYGAWSPDADVG